MPRMPTDAFDRFLALGPTRSYARLAAALGCSKRSVTARATREGWQERLARIEEQGRRKTEDRAIEDMAATNERHLKTARAVLARGLEALRSVPLTNAAAAVRAIDTAVKMERLVLGADKRPEAQGVSWTQIVDDVQRAADARQTSESVSPRISTPPQAPSVPVALRPRFVAEN